MKGRLAAGLGLAALAALLSLRTHFVAGGSDSSGYVNAAKLFSEGRAVERIEPLARFRLPDSLGNVFTPLGFAGGPRPGTMAPTYPPGLPLHMAAAALLGGWERAPFLISPIASACCFWLMFVLCRELGLSRGFALAGSAILLMFPPFLCYSLEAMSDVPATAWTLAAVVSALRARRHPNAAILAGAAFGVAVLVRPTNVLLLPALLIALPWRPGVLARFVAGGLPCLGVLLAYNAAVLGGPFRSGYGTLAGRVAFAYLVPNVRTYSYWLAVLFSPLVPLGLLASAADKRIPRRERALLLVWFGSFFIFYAFYEQFTDWLVLRFLLPGMPAMIAGALLVTRYWLFQNGALTDRRPDAGQARTSRRLLPRAACLVMLGVVLAMSAWNVRRFYVLEAWRGERVYPETCRFAAASLPATAVVVSMQMTGALRYYTALTFARWDYIDPRRFPELRERVEAQGSRWYALVAPFEREGLDRNLPGRWTQIGNHREYALLRLEPAGPSNTGGAGVP